MGTKLPTKEYILGLVSGPCYICSRGLTCVASVGGDILGAFQEAVGILSGELRLGRLSGPQEELISKVSIPRKVFIHPIVP